ncbi:uncharacterized protein LOC135494969 [Lineus longissimus]|uniref:uncharacterized protein LOC135494969 n=1 Tax=Lineus longissimus TaxID=88925 RepID=UPI00315D2865
MSGRFGVNEPLDLLDDLPEDFSNTEFEDGSDLEEDDLAWLRETNVNEKHNEEAAFRDSVLHTADDLLTQNQGPGQHDLVVQEDRNPRISRCNPRGSLDTVVSCKSFYSHHRPASNAPSSHAPAQALSKNRNSSDSQSDDSNSDEEWFPSSVQMAATSKYRGHVRVQGGSGRASSSSSRNVSRACHSHEVPLHDAQQRPGDAKSQASVDIYGLRSRVDFLMESFGSSRYQTKKSRVQKSLEIFLKHLGKDVVTCSPYDICLYLAWADEEGKTAIHVTQCTAIGSKSPTCNCPRRLAYGTVKSTISQLKAIFVELGRPDRWSSGGKGNPVISDQVSTYLKQIREEQSKGHVMVTQAKPLFMSKLILIAMYMDRQLARQEVSLEIYSC